MTSPRIVVVVTSELLPYEVEGTRWEPRTDHSHELPVTSVEVFGPGTGETVAFFPDVHAVYFKDKGELVKETVQP